MEKRPLLPQDGTLLILLSPLLLLLLLFGVSLKTVCFILLAVIGIAVLIRFFKTTSCIIDYCQRKGGSVEAPAPSSAGNAPESGASQN